MIYKYKEVISGIVFLVFATAYGIGSFNIRIYESYGNTGVNARTLPQILAITLIVLSILQVINCVKEVKAKDINENNYKKIFSRKVICTILLIAVYIGLMPTIGFLIMTIVYLVLQILLLIPQNRRNKKSYIFVTIISVAFSASVYILFVEVLSLILPRGILG